MTFTVLNKLLGLSLELAKAPPEPAAYNMAAQMAVATAAGRPSDALTVVTADVAALLGVTGEVICANDNFDRSLTMILT